MTARTPLLRQLEALKKSRSPRTRALVGQVEQALAAAASEDEGASEQLLAAVRAALSTAAAITDPASEGATDLHRALAATRAPVKNRSSLEALARTLSAATRATKAARRR